jgi:hypothetical protein
MKDKLIFTAIHFTGLTFASDGTSKLIGQTTELKSDNNLIKLVSLEDITNELNKKELDSWRD